MGELSLPGWDDPDIARLGQSFRDELRAEAEAYEALAAKDLLRRRNLTDVALELVHRGDRVTALVGGESFTGIVGYAAGDLACLRTAQGDVDLRLSGPIVLRIVERVRSGGLPRGVGPAGFTARLHEHEAAGVELELGCLQLPAALRGRIQAVGSDHAVVLEPTGAHCHVALTAITWTRPV